MDKVIGFLNTGTVMKYIFPREPECITATDEKWDILDVLRSSFKFCGIPAEFPYKIYYELGRKVTVKCRFCRNVLKYFKNKEGVFILESFSVQHHHNVEKDYEKEYDGVITVYEERQKFKEIVDEKLAQFGLRNFEEERREQNFGGKMPDNFPQLLDLLKRQNTYVYYEPENYDEELLAFPDTVMMITPQMKEMYLEYGRCIGFDFTFSLIRERPLPIDGRKNQYMIGVIAGLNSNRRLTIYAFVISNKQDGKTVYNIFSHFLRFMEREPDTIVTDQAFGMLAGLKRLKQNGQFHGQSYWDTFHVLKNYKFRHSALKKMMQLMIRQKTKIKFQEMYLQAIQMANTEDQLDSIHKFMFQSPKYCISQIKEDLFVSLCVSDSHNQMVNNLIKSLIPHEKPYTHVATTILQFSVERNKLNDTVVREMCKIQTVFDLQTLKLLRYSFSFKVFRSLFKEISKACTCQIIYTYPNLYVIEDLDSIYFVTMTDEEEIKKTDKLKYYCSCEFQGKTGIPCSHILKVLYKNDENDVLRQVDPYYVIQNPIELKECVFDRKCDEKTIKPGARRGRPTVFIRDAGKEKLPPGVIKVEKFRKRRDVLNENKEKENMNAQFEMSQFKSNFVKQDDDEDSPLKKTKNSEYRWQRFKNYFSKKQ